MNPRTKEHNRSPYRASRQLAERSFPAELEQVEVGHAWLREVLPETCRVLDDCVLVLSELLTNAIEHGGEGRVTVSVTHGQGQLQGVLTQRTTTAPKTPPKTREAPDSPATDVPTKDILYRDVPVEDAPVKGAPVEGAPVEGAPVRQVTDARTLAESRRGLAVVSTLCSGALEFEQWMDRTVFRWELTGCVCELYGEFFARLRAAYLAAGPPTYRRLSVIMRKLRAEDSSRIALGTSALQHMLTGQGKTLPRWSTLSAVIQALHVAAEETGLDPEDIGTLQDWHQRLLQEIRKP